MKYAFKFAVLALALVAPIAIHAQVFRQVGMAPVNGVRKIAAGAAGNKTASHRQIEALEQQWRQAQLKSDADTMSKMMADDYIGISANGMVQTKQQMVERVMNRKINITRMDVDELKVKIINGSTAIVTSQVDVDGVMDGRPLHGKYLYTRVYARQQGGGWKVVNFEATRMRPEPDKIADNK
ncbi:nuclear transport factor 2 family protein [Terriglobus albidus]|uniref:nuclear transport factor 2 family protein n=1 Tax=Terriglobus albidus TaxID=1592106 RepID=UPI0021E0E786|nr:nuclear transport factor 2 family protein [Terriglobus albidus]